MGIFTHTQKDEVQPGNPVYEMKIALDKAEATAGLRNVVKALAVAMVLLTLAAVGIAAFFTSQSFRRLSQWTPSAPAAAT